MYVINVRLVIVCQCGFFLLEADVLCPHLDLCYVERVIYHGDPTSYRRCSEIKQQRFPIDTLERNCKIDWNPAIDNEELQGCKQRRVAAFVC